VIAALLLATLVPDPSAWWKTYGDPVLVELVERATQANLDVRKALARIQESRALAGVARSALAPSLNWNAAAQQLRGGYQQGIIRIPQGVESGRAFVAPFETGLVSSGLDARWELSVWSAAGKQLSAARAELAAAQEAASDVRLMVAAEVARNYFEARGMERQLEILERNRARQAEVLALTRERAGAGLSPELDVERQVAELAAQESEIPRLRAEWRARMNALAVLLADREFPGKPLPPPPPSWAIPGLGDGIPSELLLRRPDVRAAHARMLAALARRKAARADIFPKVLLAGLAGRQATGFTGLSLGAGNFFAVGPQLVLPVFSGGRIRAGIEAADARLEQARLEYEQELLVAFQEAEDAIALYRAQQERIRRLETAQTSARSALELSLQLYRAGLADYLDVLDAQRSVLEWDRALADAQSSSLVQSVVLFKALAGGWPAVAQP
jgi:NodT family efflux transporter outer membrane factor (OMF) lipoprotein